MTWVKKILVLSGILGVLLIVFFIFVVRFATIHGNELGVHETWFGGVDPVPMRPGTTVFFPGFTHRYYAYDMSSQVYVMNDKPMTQEGVATGRESDAYKIQSKESQDLIISINVRWRLDPDKIVDLHTRVRDHFEEKIIRPDLLRVVKDKATIRTATECYSGEGLVQLQSDIEKALTNPESDIRKRGIIIENFVIEHIGLDAAYIEQIKSRQVAVQKELRAKQEELAALSEAKKAHAEAQADLNRKVVEAERDKQVGVLNAEQAARKEVINAEAQKQRQILAAEAEKASGIMRAEAILAVGRATAEAKRVELTAYETPGARVFAQIQIASSMSDAFKNIHGYLPQDMTMNVISSNFLQSVNEILGKPELDVSLAEKPKGNVK